MLQQSVCDLTPVANNTAKQGPDRLSVNANLRVICMHERAAGLHRASAHCRADAQDAVPCADLTCTFVLYVRYMRRRKRTFDCAAGCLQMMCATACRNASLVLMQEADGTIVEGYFAVVHVWF